MGIVFLGVITVLTVLCSFSGASARLSTAPCETQRKNDALPFSKYGHESWIDVKVNITTTLLEASSSVLSAGDAILATNAVGKTGGINARIVSPKPLATFEATNATTAGFAKIYVDTNNLSRKYKEITAAGLGGAPVNLMYWDQIGVGYVALRGKAFICGDREAQQEYWNGWDPFYPQGKDTPFYSLIRVEPDWLEFVSVSRFDVQSGRKDWAPPSLARINGTWQFEIQPMPVQPPTPGPSPSVEKWQCSVCQHIYDPQQDGNGLPFEQLPDTWKCPVCGAPKSAYHKITDDKGNVQWVHEE